MIERRGFLGQLLAFLGFGAATGTAGETRELAAAPLMRAPFQGVGVLRHPAFIEPEKMEQIRRFVENVRAGSVLILPSTCYPDNGAPMWDFQIKGGDPGQVRIERQGEHSERKPDLNEAATGGYSIERYSTVLADGPTWITKGWAVCGPNGNADAIRDLVCPALPEGFMRASTDFTLSEDRQRLTFCIVDTVIKTDVPPSVWGKWSE